MISNDAGMANREVDERQLTLALPGAPPRMGRANFIVSAGNARDFAALSAWLATDESLILICGPVSSGKTHLASIIVEALGAAILAPDSSGRLPADARDIAAAAGGVVVDSVEALCEPDTLLELAQHCRLNGVRLALVGRGGPGDWAGGLVDLSTRLEAAPRIVTSAPDEPLVREVMAKMFRDRQLAVPDAMIEYAARRLPRRLSAVAAFVEALEATVATRQAPASVRLAGSLIADLSFG